MFTPVVPTSGPRPSIGRRRSSMALVNINEDVSSHPGSLAFASPPPMLSRRSSIRSIRRLSSKCSLKTQPVVTKNEVPAHLAKMLQKTEEQQARVDVVKSILAIDPSTRPEMSLDIVYDWMLQNCKQHSNNIFGSAPEYIRREICRQMRLTKATTHQLIIRQGDTGDRCYIVVDGLVDVYIKMEQPKREDDNDESAGSSSNAGRKSTAALTADMSAALRAVEYGTMVANLGPGAMFGEVVLMNPTARRNATILASQYTETCDLICLERADYSRLVRGASMEASHYNQAEILDHMWLFHGWAKHDKMRLVSAMRSMHFVSNEYLYRAGTDARWMFIISSGEVLERLNWSVGRPATTTVSLPGGNGSNSARSALTGPGTTGGLSSTGLGLTGLGSAASSSSSSSPSPSLGGGTLPEKKVNIDLLLVGQGDIVGELPFVTNKWSAGFDIRALVDVHALAIDRRLYENMILNATAETNRAAQFTRHRLRRLMEEREDWRQQRLACGTAYPTTRINMTWQLMRMSALRCPRCGLRGHLAVDVGRCAHPSSPKKPSVAPAPTSTSTTTTEVSNAQRKKSTHGARSPTRESARRELFDDSYLPSASAQLARCRLDREQHRVHAPVSYTSMYPR